jgi:hypothetical protein
MCSAKIPFTSIQLHYGYKSIHKLIHRKCVELENPIYISAISRFFEQEALSLRLKSPCA